ncbi:MAG: putative glutamine ABC transporter permease protein GlnM [Anaerolineae bacterium]|nr:putative glutamine ABC transporter permease protein GlnM [Anaerolineae bacterium]
MNDSELSRKAPSPQIKFTDTLSGLPWWLLIIILAGVLLAINFATNQTYQEIFKFLRSGIGITIRVTLIAYAIAITLGLITGLARVSSNAILYNIATIYVQIMRGLPILVTILYVAFVFIPMVVTGINALGEWLANIGLLGPENILAMLGNRRAGLELGFEFRAIIALAFSYGAFSSEIFRAGIESIGRGQMEAARSLGMSYFQAMRHIILPQAVRRVLPPLGNDFIAMLKESSLVSALGVQDITQLGRLYSASSFEYLKTYNMVAFMYLTMTILLSLGVKGMEMRLKTDD